MIRKPLVDGAGLFKTIIVMLLCHASVTFLCVNVMFDLFIFGVPLYLLHAIGILHSSTFYKLTSMIINWTTPIVYGAPMVFSGTKLLIDNDVIDLLHESKAKDSLLLSNHGSRIDWMVAMFCGHLTSVANKPTVRCRVGFVCEALIQLMPLIGWYRKVICDDIFVWRSFDRDAPSIKKSIDDFHCANQQRMLFLSPEGIVVDHGEKDMDYIHECRAFCKTLGYKSFDYVLTPRYKGTACLLDQVAQTETFISICCAFVRDGKLLNCHLLSSERVVPDIYDLNQGIAGKPVDIYIHLRKIDPKKGKDFNARDALMQEYVWKDSLLAQWDEDLKKGNTSSMIDQFTRIEPKTIDVLMNHFLHVVVIVATVMAFNYLDQLIKLVCGIFVTVSVTHTAGWMVNESSMESVPFETGIKALIMTIISMKQKYSSKQKHV